MDYPQHTRLKRLGRVRTVSLEHAPELAAALIDAYYCARVERGFVVDVESFAWICSQHITPRFTAGEIAFTMKPLQDRITDLKVEVTRLRSQR